MYITVPVGLFGRLYLLHHVSGSTAVLEGIIYQASYCVMKVHPLLDTNPPIAVLAEISAA
jgi:hypothetical protein